MIKYEESAASVQHAARTAYEAYIANSGGLAWDGRPCPTWDKLLADRSPVCSHWCAAVIAWEAL